MLVDCGSRGVVLVAKGYLEGRMANVDTRESRRMKVDVWGVADGIAWVAAEPARVALIDTRDPMAQPMLVQSPFAELWEAVAEGPRSEADLLTVATGLVHDEGEALRDEFIRSIGGVGLIEVAA